MANLAAAHLRALPTDSVMYTQLQTKKVEGMLVDNQKTNKEDNEMKVNDVGTQRSTNKV